LTQHAVQLGLCPRVTVVRTCEGRSNKLAAAYGLAVTGTMSVTTLCATRGLEVDLVSRNATSASAYLGIPPNRAVELGMQVEL
jgi:K+ transporter